MNTVGERDPMSKVVAEHDVQRVARTDTLGYDLLCYRTLS